MKNKTLRLFCKSCEKPMTTKIDIDNLKSGLNYMILKHESCNQDYFIEVDKDAKIRQIINLNEININNLGIIEAYHIRGLYNSYDKKYGNNIENRIVFGREDYLESINELKQNKGLESNIIELENSNINTIKTKDYIISICSAPFIKEHLKYTIISLAKDLIPK